MLRECLDNVDRTTIMFEANLGHTPTANRDNLLLAFGNGIKSAAISKAKQTAKDTNNTLRLVNDAMSCITGTEFVGTHSTLFKNKQNLRNGSFCTMPV